MAKRISFNECAAEDIYEWLVMYWKGDLKCGGCYSCQKLRKRLQKFIGPKAAKRVRKDVREHPCW